MKLTTPAYLQKGDMIAIVAPAGILNGFSPGQTGAEVIFTVPENSGTLEYFDASGTISGTGNVFTPSNN